MLVMLCGVLSTLATFVFFSLDALDIMREYWVVVIALPGGAWTLGLLAGSGYGIAAWKLTRFRFTVWMLLFIVGSMFVAYWVLAGIEYARFAPDNVGFFEYFDQATRNTVMVSDGIGGQTVTTRLGPRGYYYRFIELAALCFGGFSGCFVGLFVAGYQRQRQRDRALSQPPPRRKSSSRERAEAKEVFVPCPFCGKKIHSRAERCLHCDSDVF
jgi:predicted RNA-binding Zn-ribbon protein involved in translation (DUF1610 family)